MKRLLATIVAFLVLSGGAQAASPAFSTESTNSFWNQPVPSTAVTDPGSSAYTASLVQQVQQSGQWINTYQYSVPIFYAASNTPTQRVTVTGGQSNPEQGTLQSGWQAVPIPPGAQPAAGSDEDMVVVQPSTDSFWEFWQASHGTTWSASWGGYMSHVSTGGEIDQCGDANPGGGYYPWCNRYFGVRGSGLPLLGGLIRASDVFDGQINHALVISIPHAQAAWFRAPAYRTDGNQNGANLPMEGMELQLDPTYNVDANADNPLLAMIEHAAQTYGIYIADQGGSVSFYGEDTGDEHRPEIWYGPQGFFGGVDPAHVLAGFPWARLRVIQAPNFCCWQR